MIRGFGAGTASTCSPTLKGRVTGAYLTDLLESMEVLNGPVLVSRTGDEG